VGSATLHLQNQSGATSVDGQTAADGSYTMLGVGKGTYILEVSLSGNRKTTFGPFSISIGEVKEIELTLPTSLANHSETQTGNGTLQFDDAPEFTVSGVTDAASPGGHGSNVVLQTAESLARQTSSLGDASEHRDPAGDAAVEKTLRESLDRLPADFSANHRLGAFLMERGRFVDAVPFLERAFKANPADFENSYALAQAEANSGKVDVSLNTTEELLARPDLPATEQAALHRLLGDVHEKLNRPLEAVRDYERAAELDPSESNLFDWGSELLKHRALDPAIEVFGKGDRLFPNSARMLIGLGVANYARGFNDDAVARLCQASDLAPQDQDPYLFLGKIETAESNHAACLIEKLRRFAKLQPENALANYYYALTFARSSESPENPHNTAQVKMLLEKAIALDPNFGAAYFQLGVFYSSQKDFASAVPAYQQAILHNPDLAEAHFRLARAYASTGERAKAEAETELYRQTSKKAAEQADHERREIQDFVFTLRDQSPGQH
jgi:tetratricopeptide (TPR) repeat protein